MDPYDAHLPGSFFPSTAQRLTEQETVRQSVQERQADQPVAPPTVSWPPSGGTPINEFNTEGYISCAFPILFPTGAADFVLPIMSSYRLSHGQYAYSGTCNQSAIASFANSLP